MRKLFLSPNELDYNPTLGDGVLTQQLTAGMPRQRRNFIGATHGVTLSWSLNIDEMELLLAFYFANQYDPQPFLMDLIFDYTSLKEYQVAFIGSLKWSKEGNLWRANIDAVAKPSPRSPDDDDKVIEAWRLGLIQASPSLEKLANKAAADALEPFL